MPSSVRRPAAVITALLILAFGAAYLVHRPARWTSTSSVVLVPTQGAERSSIIESFARSGIAGTFVEYLSGSSVRNRAGDPAGDLTVRVIPDTRVITLSLTGTDEQRVTRELDALVSAGIQSQDELGDPWRIRVLTEASAPVRAGPSTPLVVAATVLIALLAAIAILALPTRSRPPAQQEAVLDDVAERKSKQAA